MWQSDSSLLFLLPYINENKLSLYAHFSQINIYIDKNMFFALKLLWWADIKVQ